MPKTKKIINRALCGVSFHIINIWDIIFSHFIRVDHVLILPAKKDSKYYVLDLGQGDRDVRTCVQILVKITWSTK